MSYFNTINKTFSIKYDLPSTFGTTGSPSNTTVFTTPPNRGNFAIFMYGWRIKPGITYSTFTFSVGTGASYTSLLVSQGISYGSTVGAFWTSTPTSWVVPASTALNVKNQGASNFTMANGQMEFHVFGQFQF